jgi:hypothetical protein
VISPRWGWVSGSDRASQIQRRRVVIGVIRGRVGDLFCPDGIGWFGS